MLLYYQTDMTAEIMSNGIVDPVYDGDRVCIYDAGVRYVIIGKINGFNIEIQAPFKESNDTVHHMRGEKIFIAGIRITAK